MKKLLTQFGKELRDSTQSIISKEVLEFLHTTSLTGEDVTYLTKTISGVGFDNENNIRKLCYLISNSYLPLQTIDTTSQGGIELALSHATPFEDDLGDWNEIHNRNERINELILEVFKTIYQKEEEK